MSGNLFSGERFEQESYRGADGREHSELVPVDGDFFSIGNSSWDRMVECCTRYGIPADDWPVYEDAIDIPLDDVRRKNELLRDQLLNLPRDLVEANENLRRIVAHVREGKLVAYCRL